MNRLAVAAAFFGLAILPLAGCLDSPPPRTNPNFQNAGPVQEGGDFQLTVHVYGVENGSVPIEGARVGAAAGDQGLAKSVTDASGTTPLTLKRDQEIEIVAKADGWTTEDSGRIILGSPDSEASAQASCEFFIYEGSCVVSASEESTAYHLEGGAGSVTIVLFRSHVTQKFTATVEPSAAVPGNNGRWYPVTKPIESEADLHRLYMDRLTEVVGTVAWTNELISQGDFNAGVGCEETQTQQVSEESTVPDYGQGSRSAKVDWDVPQDGWWSSCDNVYIGPVTSNELNSAQEIGLTLEFTFEGKSRIRPIGL